MKELIEIQSRLNAPKSRHCDYGKYDYRNAEDILKAVKPLLLELKCTLTMSDEVIEVGQAYTYNTQSSKNGNTSATSYNGTRVYVKATVTLKNSDGEVETASAMAREEVAKAGMDAAQITGSTSSYARKYALNGLFAIDDGVDADKLNATAQAKQQTQFPKQVDANGYSLTDIFNAYAKPVIEQARTKEDLAKIFKNFKNLQGMKEFTSALTAQRKKLGIKNSNEK